MDVAEPITLDEVVLEELATHLRRLDQHGIGALERSLAGLADGDFTQRLEAEPAPLLLDAEDARLRALVDLVNGMHQRVEGAVAAYEQLRRDLNAALGDRSSLPELLAALRSLNAHCLSDLDRGLQAMADGDLTISARPVTHPLRAAPGNHLGELGEVFNLMLARSRTALRSYDAVREDLRTALGDHSCLDDLRAGLKSLQRHCLRDLEEALEAVNEGTALTRPIAPVTTRIDVAEGETAGELATLFNRALERASTAVRHLAVLRDRRAER